MLDTASFINQYEQYSDEELYSIYINRTDYSEQAQTALDIVIKRKGGLEIITSRLQQKQNINNEIKRIELEATQLSTSSNDVSFLAKMITSDILHPEKVKAIVEQKINKIQLQHQDKKIKPQTIYGSLIGGSIGSIIGGVIWGLQLIQMNRIFVVLLVGLALLSYGLIKAFTRQTKNNVVVLIATIISVLGALIIGQLLFEIYD